MAIPPPPDTARDGDRFALKADAYRLAAHRRQRARVRESLLRLSRPEAAARPRRI